MSWLNTLIMKLWSWYKGHDGVTDAHHAKYTDAEAVTALTNDLEGCKVNRTSALTVIQNTWTKINADIIRYNLNNGYSAITERYTAPKNGYYIISATVTLESLNDNKMIIVWIKKNDSGIIQNRAYSGGGSYTAVNTSTIEHLSANDYIEMFIYHTDITTRFTKASGSATGLAIIKV